ncbi:hypothetical protein GYMLUDRAFT_176523, partial [Collybiopsis luxurians FD-317 M1]
MTESSYKIDVLPKLIDDGSNWHSWKEKVYTNIISKPGLQRHINRNGKWYTSTLDTAVPLTDNNLEKLEEQIDTYHQCEAQIKDIIYKCLSESTLNSIKGARSAHTAWVTLCGLFEKKGDLIHTSLLATLQATRCSEDDDLRAHLNKMDNIRQSLTAMGQPLPDGTYIAYLKLSIPESYQSI